MAVVDLSSLVPSVSNLVGALNGINVGDLAQSAAIGGLVTIATAGLKSADGQNVLDPLHWFHNQGTGQTAVVSGKVITGANFAALPPASQTAILAAGYQIVG